MAKHRTPPLNIIILGYPTAGKGTQSRMLTKRYHLYHFSSGVALRKLAETKTEQGRRLKKMFQAGHLPPASLVTETQHRAITSTPASKGIVFDGNPRRITEAKLYIKWLKQAGRDNPLVIYLTIPVSEMYKRTVSREVSQNGKIEKRDEDNLAALRKRITWTKSITGESYRFLRKHYPGKRISGLGSRDEVHKRIVKEIEAYKKTL